ncbi:MAG: hypothetical protein ABIQ89_02760 [Candidatus Saccharimonadales bacterium]
MATAKTPTPKPTTPETPTPPAPAVASTSSSHKTALIIVGVVVAVFIVLPLIGLAVGGVFIGKSLKDNNVKVNSGDSSVSVSDKNGNEFSAGGSQTLPSDFPSGVPLYKGDIVTTGKVNSDGKTVWSVSISTSDSSAQVHDAMTQSYTSDGWEASINNSGEGSGLLAAKKNDMQVSAYYASKDGKTVIVYTVANGLTE